MEINLPSRAQASPPRDTGFVSSGKCEGKMRSLLMVIFYFQATGLLTSSDSDSSGSSDSDSGSDSESTTEDNNDSPVKGKTFCLADYCI